MANSVIGLIYVEEKGRTGFSLGEFFFSSLKGPWLFCFLKIPLGCGDGGGNKKKSCYQPAPAATKNTGARYMSALLGSLIPSVICTGVVSGKEGVIIFENGVEVR